MNGTYGAILEGFDSVWEAQDAPSQWMALQALRTHGIQGLWLVVVPNIGSALMQQAQRTCDPATVVCIVPDMRDDQRREVALKLRQGNTDYLFVTPERFAQPKFVQFMNELRPRLAVASSGQRLLSTQPDYLLAYDALHDMGNQIADCPTLVLLDHDADNGLSEAITTTLKLRLPPCTEDVRPDHAPTAACQKEPASFVDPSPAPTPTLPVRNEPSAAGWERAFPHFDRKESFAEVAAALTRPEKWCLDALIHYIRQTGQSSPFPWVDQPSYLAVALVVGQAESTDPKVVLSILGERVEPDATRIVLAALENRARMAPGSPQ